MVVDVGASDPYLFLGLRVDEVPRTQVRVLGLCDSEWCPERPDKVNIVEFFATMDHSRHGLLLDALFERISRLPHSDWI